MAYTATKQHVYNRGIAPDAFLDELIAWGKEAPEEIFAPNAYSDIYSSVKNTLGPWQSNDHRRAVMLEVLRVLGGFESSWRWDAGPDTTNPASNTPLTEEAGLWQVSADSMALGPELKQLAQQAAGSTDPLAFQQAMKANHRFAIEYTARLLRRTTHHHGPVRDHKIDAWLRKDAVQEFMRLLGVAAASPTLTAAAPGNALSRQADAATLHPAIRDAVLATQAQLNAEAIPFRLFEGFRSPQRQQQLYAQGRAVPGPIVTYAQPWESFHQFGLAVDFVLFENGQWSWDDSTPNKKKWWKRLHEVGRKNALFPLDFEAPHLQVGGTTVAALRAGRYPAGGDESWAEHLSMAIQGWSGSPSSPPLPVSTGRPAVA
ncbi:M15 family metallopeptidase [uncultured Pseudacidovorax sp.]|uniref:M15 family metallopeptidase n=1 Tax=uncultured Pseudacidovorax sp. TaxID=679313 RepID=UPI0025FBA510|nr:M15 family metallopeptidase [uncultured Pseudacidovorax sp.]